MFLAGLIVATFIDFEHFIIPDEITFGGTAVGIVASFLLPSLQDAGSRGAGMWRSVLGAAAGAGMVYAILRLGKLLFGRQRLQLPSETKIVFSETAVHLPDKEIPYDELFYRKSDVIVLQRADGGTGGPLLQGRGGAALARRRWKSATRRSNPDDVPYHGGVCSEIVLPREAMGLGDVKFMAAIGAFIGWQGAVFSLMVSSLDRRGGGRGADFDAASANGRRECLTALISRWRR